MEKRILLWISVLFLASATVLAQNKPVGVIVALKKGNANELASYFGDKIDLVIENRTKSVDKSAAKEMLGTFFEQNRVKGFDVNHEGERGESSFFVGTLTTDNGKYRINCFFKKIQNKYLIHQIRIDKTNE